MSIETCRHWLNSKTLGPHRCNEPATIVVWGIGGGEPEDFGPKCSKHWPAWVDASRLDQYAVLDLRPLDALADRLAVAEAAIGTGAQS